MKLKEKIYALIDLCQNKLDIDKLSTITLRISKLSNFDNNQEILNKKDFSKLEDIMLQKIDDLPEESHGTNYKLNQGLEKLIAEIKDLYEPILKSTIKKANSTLNRKLKTISGEESLNEALDTIAELISLEISSPYSDTKEVINRGKKLVSTLSDKFPEILPQLDSDHKRGLKTILDGSFQTTSGIGELIDSAVVLLYRVSSEDEITTPAAKASIIHTMLEMTQERYDHIMTLN